MVSVIREDADYNAVLAARKPNWMHFGAIIRIP